MLTPRLKCIVNHVNSEIAADIGTDHAYVSVELIKTGRSKKVIATDINEGPLKIAEANIRKNNMADKIETRLGSGISVIGVDEVDTVIIAGMGGELICAILKNDFEKAKHPMLVLQPMNSQYETRKWLKENNFGIICEDIECEGKRVYNIMEVKYNESGLNDKLRTDIDFHLPNYLYRHEKFNELLDKKQREFLKIINGLSRSVSCDYEKLEYYKECYKKSEEIKKNVNQRYN